MIFDSLQTLKVEKTVAKGPSTAMNSDGNKAENKSEGSPVQIKVFASDPTQYTLSEDDEDDDE